MKELLKRHKRRKRPQKQAACIYSFFNVILQNKFEASCKIVCMCPQQWHRGDRLDYETVGDAMLHNSVSAVQGVVRTILVSCREIYPPPRQALRKNISKVKPKVRL
jgi:hypothetical protein